VNGPQGDVVLGVDAGGATIAGSIAVGVAAHDGNVVQGANPLGAGGLNRNGISDASARK